MLVTAAVRDATAEDIPAIAAVVRSATRAAYTFMNWDHDDASFEGSVRGRFDAWTRVRVAIVDGSVAGVACLEGNELDQLFVAPAMQGRGIGSRLLTDVKKLCPAGFTLYTFQANRNARRFYAAHGVVETGYGVSEAEGEPDVSLKWTPLER